MLKSERRLRLRLSCRKSIFTNGAVDTTLWGWSLFLIVSYSLIISQKPSPLEIVLMLPSRRLISKRLLMLKSRAKPSLSQTLTAVSLLTTGYVLLKLGSKCRIARYPALYTLVGKSARKYLLRSLSAKNASVAVACRRKRTKCVVAMTRPMPASGWPCPNGRSKAVRNRCIWINGVRNQCSERW
jgi:hypothetical protein